MNEWHEDKGVGKKNNAGTAEANEDNDKVVQAKEDKEKETVPDAEARGGGDEPDRDGIAESSGASDPSHGEGVMEPNGEGDGDVEKMDEGDSPPGPTKKWCVLRTRKARRKRMNPWKRESKEERQGPQRMSTTSPPHPK